MRPHIRTLLLLTFTLPVFAPAEPGDTVYQHGYPTKEEALKSVEVPEGYALELVLSEPDLKEPVAIARDGNGALYVVEMRTCMEDIDATGARQPTSRLSRQEDPNGDGVYEKHSVFVDNLMLPPMVVSLRDAKFTDSMEKGSAIYQQICFTCHGQDGKGTHIPGQDITLAPTLVGSPRVLGSGGSLARVILHGMTGPLDGKSYPNVMVPMAANGDAWVAAVANYVRNSFGNDGGFIDESFITTTRERAGNRTTPWTEAELDALEPPVLPNRSDWKLTASHGQNDVRNAVDGNRGSRWATGTSQVPGMWFQLELPSESTVNRIVLDAANSDRDYPRGYEVTLSNDGKTWSKPVASGLGTGAVTDIAFPAETARFLRLTNTGQVNGLFWSIHDLTVYGKPNP